MMASRSLPALRLIALLALPALPLAAREANAQRLSPAATVDAENYRLSMPVLRKVLPVLYAPGAKTECVGGESRDIRSMGVEEMQKLLDRCPPVVRAAVAQGVSTREAALVSKALILVAYRMAQEESAKISGRAAAPLPPGPLRDNVALLRRNEAEVARLSGESE